MRRAGIADFERLLEAWELGSPLPWDPDDAEPVADAVCFLLSDLARAITGQILHVDGGYSAMAAPPVRPGSAGNFSGEGVSPGSVDARSPNPA